MTDARSGSTSDPVGTALFSVGAGATTGAAVMTGGVAALRYLQAGGEPDPNLAFAIVTGTALGGLAAAVATGWVCTGPIDDRWRRAVTAAVSAFGAVLLALVATPVDLLLGTPGIAGYLVLLVAGLLSFHHAARHAGSR